MLTPPLINIRILSTTTKIQIFLFYFVTLIILDFIRDQLKFANMSLVPQDWRSTWRGSFPETNERDSSGRIQPCQLLNPAKHWTPDDCDYSEITLQRTWLTTHSFTGPGLTDTTNNGQSGYNVLSLWCMFLPSPWWYMFVPFAPSQCGAKAERRTRDRVVQGSKIACAIWVFP